MQRFFIHFIFFIILTGCNSSSNITPTTKTLASFSDGSGALKKDIAEPASGAVGDITKLVAISPDVSKWVSDFSYADAKTLSDNNLPIAETNFRGTGIDYYEGDITIVGDQLTISLFEPTTGVGSLAVGHDPSSNQALVALGIGPKATNIPSGNFTYTGLNIVGAKYDLLDNNGNPLTTGTGFFTLNVNFSDGTGNFSATTDAINTTSISGNVTVDSTTGEIFGENLIWGGSINGVDMTGKTSTLAGSFHGDGATNVTGIYYTDQLSYGGGFLGER